VGFWDGFWVGMRGFVSKCCWPCTAWMYWEVEKGPLVDGSGGVAETGVSRKCIPSTSTALSVTSFVFTCRVVGSSAGVLIDNCCTVSPVENISFSLTLEEVGGVSRVVVGCCNLIFCGILLRDSSGAGGRATDKIEERFYVC
jgi:hypothetical protein